MGTKTMAAKATKTAKGGRCRVFVIQEPGPGKRFFVMVYFADGSVYTYSELEPQRNCLKLAKNMAKENQPASVILQGVNGKFREVFSYPPVRNRPSNERKAAK